MSEAIVAALLTALGAVGGGAAAYFAKRRGSSGSVQTSEAKDLWAEASAMRLALRDEVTGLRSEVDRRNTEIDQLEGVIATLRKENGELWAHKRAREGRSA